MALKNYKDVLIDLTRIPKAIEDVIPVKTIPKVSNMLAQGAAKLPNLPDFPIGVPAIPSFGAKTTTTGAVVPGYNGGVEQVPASAGRTGGKVQLLFE